MTKTTVLILMVIGAVVVPTLVLLGFNKIEGSVATNLMLTATLVGATLGLWNSTARYVKETSEIAKATSEQAEASRQMAEEMKQARFNSMHPVLTVITSVQYVGVAGEWHKGPIDTIDLSIDVQITNIGIGPALNGELSLESKGQSVRQVKLPPLKSGEPYYISNSRLIRGAIGDSPVEDWKAIDKLLLSCHDIFRNRHEDSIMLEDVGDLQGKLRVSQVDHNCLGRATGKEKQGT
ncbi:MAG: hypothetical protein HY676_04060 [Chloroflexi bacterium]|nr:hypothetical protein [Chloroflexota bacterium]